MNKLTLITGATGALGKATALELAKNNCHVILLGRNSGKLNTVRTEIEKSTGNKEIYVVVADLSEPESVIEATSDIKKEYSSLNALINTAAIFKSQRLENSLGTEYMLSVNHLGPFILTNGLIDLLKAGKPARIITVTAPSTTKINFDDINGEKKYSPGFMGMFGATKMMNIMFTYSLARRLEGTGVTTDIFHPGLIKSNLTNEMPAFLNFIFQSISSAPDKAAKMLCSLAIDNKYENSNGQFFKSDGNVFKSSKYSYEKDLQEKLWKMTEQISEVRRLVTK